LSVFLAAGTSEGGWNQRKAGHPFFVQLSVSMTHRGGYWKKLHRMPDNRAASPQYRAMPENACEILDTWTTEAGDLGQLPEDPSAVTQEDRIKTYGE